LAVGIASTCGDSSDPRVLYLVLLFLLCSTPVIDLDSLNGRYALLGLFLLTYFVMFGVSDLTALVQSNAKPDGTQTAHGVSMTEAVILVGGVLTYLGYHLAVAAGSAIKEPPFRRDWPKSAVCLVGLSMWAIGTYATYDWYVYIVPGTTNGEIRRELQNEGMFAASAYILAQMMLPLGFLLIVYWWRVYRPRLLWALVVAMVAIQVVIGFVAELKGLAMFGGILVIASIVLLDGRLPKAWLAGAIIFVVLVFPVLQAYRAEVAHNRGISRATVVADLGRALNLALSAESRVYSGRERAQTFLERSSLLGSVQTIVENTGNGVPYQNGHTMAPLLSTFVPRILWSEKPDVPTGQIMNKAFHITESEDIYLSPSHVGELYWNFGWWGVVVGMPLIGIILGIVGGCFNLAQGRSVTRLLVTVLTIKQLIAGFESAITSSYVVWLRSLAGIGLLHLIFARSYVAGRFSSRDTERRLSPAGTSNRYSNLLT
jgi:hypothetical protein